MSSDVVAPSRKAAMRWATESGVWSPSVRK
jgi:hypothetical protein